MEYQTSLCNLKLLVLGLSVVSSMLGILGILLLEEDQEEFKKENEEEVKVRGWFLLMTSLNQEVKRNGRVILLPAACLSRIHFAGARS